MVERQRKIVVVDLDGTLIDGNSLHLYIRTALSHSSLTVKARIASLLALRKMRLISHTTMKFAILNMVKPDEAFRKHFVQQFEKMKRQSVVSLIDIYTDNGAIIVLATAAPDIYLPWIWTGKYVATQTDNNPLHKECRGKSKLEAVRQYMDNGTLEAVITDHTDDLPLLLAGARTNILVNPSKRLTDTLTGRHIPYIILPD